MNLEIAMEKLTSHPEIKGLIFGIIADDGSFRLDCAAYIDEKDFKKEASRFIKFRKFVLKEKDEHGS